MIRARTFEEFVELHNKNSTEQYWLPVQVKVTTNDNEDITLTLVLHSTKSSTEPSIWSSTKGYSLCNTRLLELKSEDKNFAKFCEDNEVNCLFGDVLSAYYMENSYEIDEVDEDSYDFDEEDFKLSVDSVLWSINERFESQRTIHSIKVIPQINPNLE